MISEEDWPPPFPCPVMNYSPRANKGLVTQLKLAETFFQLLIARRDGIMPTPQKSAVPRSSPFGPVGLETVKQLP